MPPQLGLPLLEARQEYLGATRTRNDGHPGAILLRGFAAPRATSSGSDVEAELFAALDEVIAAAPLRHFTTAGGFTMSVASTNCGALGWFSDHGGYRYSSTDPQSDRPWPAMPVAFADLATRAASSAGYADFVPNACLVNRYDVGARMSLHQDRNEGDFSAPIVSVSLGVPATFLFGGLNRSDPAQRVRLVHGDVVVWGGAERLCFHGILPLAADHHPRTGAHRFNLTFRQVASPTP